MAPIEFAAVKIAYPILILLLVLFVTGCTAATRSDLAPEVAEADRSRGQMLTKQAGCIMCHSVDGTSSVGPTWQGLYLDTVTLADGSNITADLTYLRTAITEPNVQIVKGYGTQMPTYYNSLLSEDDVNDILAYIISLP